jgi:hypothetical protein
MAASRRGEGNRPGDRTVTRRRRYLRREELAGMGPTRSRRLRPRCTWCRTDPPAAARDLRECLRCRSPTTTWREPRSRASCGSTSSRAAGSAPGSPDATPRDHGRGRERVALTRSWQEIQRRQQQLRGSRRHVLDRRGTPSCERGGMPRLRISPFYRRLIDRNNPEATRDARVRAREVPPAWLIGPRGAAAHHLQGRQEHVKYPVGFSRLRLRAHGR